tara:strand:+ start:19822 stop:20643 length:822 start_codon:yes stop_codon:yes gene_type:complete
MTTHILRYKTSKKTSYVITDLTDYRTGGRFSLSLFPSRAHRYTEQQADAIATHLARISSVEADTAPEGYRYMGPSIYEAEAHAWNGKDGALSIEDRNITPKQQADFAAEIADKFDIRFNGCLIGRRGTYASYAKLWDGTITMGRQAGLVVVAHEMAHLLTYQRDRHVGHRRPFQERYIEIVAEMFGQAQANRLTSEINRLKAKASERRTGRKTTDPVPMPGAVNRVSGGVIRKSKKVEGRYIADISIDGKRCRRRFPNQTEAQTWLDSHQVTT